MGTETLPQQIDSSNNKMFVIVAASVLLTSAITGFAVYSWQKSANEKAINILEQQIISLKEQISTIKDVNTTPQPTSAPALTPLPTGSSIINWKTYINEAYGYQISYPKNWYLNSPNQKGYDPLCLENTQNQSIIEVSKEKLQSCGFIGEQLPPEDAEFTIFVLNEEWQNFPDILGDPDEIITIDGEMASKYFFTESSNLPNVQAVRIYFNYNGKGYLIFLKQSDLKGNYDPIYDQILSTFKFIE